MLDCFPSFWIHPWREGDTVINLIVDILWIEFGNQPDKQFNWRCTGYISHGIEMGEQICLSLLLNITMIIRRRWGRCIYSWMEVIKDHLIYGSLIFKIVQKHNLSKSDCSYCRDFSFTLVQLMQLFWVGVFAIYGAILSWVIKQLQVILVLISTYLRQL